VLAWLPFGTRFTLPTGGFAIRYPPTSVSCGPAVVEAIRTPPRDAGWFGFTPLTSTPEARGVVADGACYEPARHRLIVSAVGLFVAALLGWWSFRIERDDGWTRRRRRRPSSA
jgi:hypothetical protein